MAILRYTKSKLVSVLDKPIKCFTMNALKINFVLQCKQVLNLSELPWRTIIYESETKFGNDMCTFSLVCVSVKHMIGDWFNLSPAKKSAACLQTDRMFSKVISFWLESHPLSIRAFESLRNLPYSSITCG